MADDGNGAAGVASNMIWALAFIVVVGLIVGGLYYGGVLSNKKKSEVDINLTAPGR